MYQRRNLRRSKHHSGPAGAVHPDVRVPVLQHALVPAAVGPPELVVAVDDAVRVVGVVEVDHVVADEVHRHLRLAQRLHEPDPQRVAAALLAPDPHVGGEQRDHHVHVARVERERVAVRELLDLGQRLQPVDALVRGRGLPGSET